MRRMRTNAGVALVVVGLALAAGPRAWGSKPPMVKLREAQSALEVGDYSTFVAEATGMLAVFPHFESRSELSLQVVKCMMFLGRYEEARQFSKRAIEKNPYSVMNGELKRELWLLDGIEEIPDDLVQMYLEAEKMVMRQLLQRAIEQYSTVVDDPRSEGTRISVRAKYEATRMDYVLLDKDFPKDRAIFPEDLIDLWQGYLAEAANKEEEFLGVVNVLRVYSRYSEDRRAKGLRFIRPDFLTMALDMADEYKDAFEDKEQRLLVEYRVALLHKKLGLYLVLKDANAAMRQYGVAADMIQKIIDENPKWFLVTQGIRHAVEMRVGLGQFKSLYNELQEHIKTYPNNNEIAKALEYFARFTDQQQQFDYSICTNQLILRHYPYTKYAADADQRQLPMLAAVDRGDLTVNLCEITYDEALLKANERVGPAPPGGVKEITPEERLAEQRTKERKALNRRYMILGIFVIALVIVFLFTRRKA